MAAVRGQWSDSMHVLRKTHPLLFVLPHAGPRARHLVIAAVLSATLGAAANSAA